MYKLLLVTAALMMSGCGLQNQLNDLKNTTSKDSDRIDSIESRVSVLEAQMQSSKASILALESSQASTQSQLDANTASLQAQIDALTSSGTATQAEIDGL